MSTCFEIKIKLGQPPQCLQPRLNQKLIGCKVNVFNLGVKRTPDFPVSLVFVLDDGCVKQVTPPKIATVYCNFSVRDNTTQFKTQKLKMI